jgi:hypothetical protein
LLDPAASFVCTFLVGANAHTDWLAGTLEFDKHAFVVTGRDLLRDDPAS